MTIAANLHCLDQAIALLERLDDDQYSRRRGEWSAVGAHYRHLLEHYQCLLEGAVPKSAGKSIPSGERSNLIRAK